jgi:osmotically inducible lipoprotein OsmB
MTILKIAPLMAAALMLAGCGTSTGDRGLSGAGLGAAVGALAGPPGMLVGAAVGAGTGMATSPRDVNLGPPPWKG